MPIRPSLVRKIVGIGFKESKPLHEPVIHHTWTGQDFQGTDTYVDVPRLSLVRHELQQRHREDGSIVQVAARMTFLQPILANGAAGRDEPVDPNDEFTLADGTRAAVADVEGPRDPEKQRPFLLKVFLAVEGETSG